MEDCDYLFECPDPDGEELARVIAGLFPAQTRFTCQIVGEGALQLNVHWVAMRFATTARRMTMTFAIAPAALARYRALPARLRSRSFAVLHAYAEAALGSLEERYAQGEHIGRDMVIDLGDEFA